MWSIAVYDYGLTDEQFKRLTPIQFHYLGKRFDATKKHQDLGFGIVASTIANAHRDHSKQKKPFVAQDFMPVYDTPKKKTGNDLKQYWDTMVRPHADAAEKAREKLRRRGGDE